MPKIVDHDERRDIVAIAAVDVIAKKGIANATLQDISQAAGYSTRVVSHYFNNKRNMMLFTFKYAQNTAVASAQADLERQHDKLLALALFMLPTDAQRRNWWRVWLEFFSMVATDAFFAQEMRKYSRFALRLYKKQIVADQEAGQFPRGLDPDITAHRIIACVTGASTMAMWDPVNWTNARIRSAVEAEIQTLRSVTAPAPPKVRQKA